MKQRDTLHRYEKNERLTLEIADLGNDGEGIGHVDGYTVFVKDALPGDRIEARILKAKKGYAYARLEKVLSPSPFRIEPKCPVHRSCGGCQIQALDYAGQLRLKENKVRSNLQRIGSFSPEELDAIWNPILGMEEPWHYRNKAQYPVGTDREGNLVAGFYAGRTHSIIPMTDCAIGAKSFGKIMEAILAWMKRHHIPAYEEETGKGLVRHVLLREGFYTGEIMVCLVINGTSVPAAEDLVTILSEMDFPEVAGAEPGLDTDEGKAGKPRHITSICYSSNTADTNVIMGNSFRILYGNGYITDKIGDISFRISPLSFFQVNPVQTRVLYGKALEYAALTGQETVWDLYCGIGTISLFLAQSAARVCGVEIIPQAIENAKENAALNGIANAEFYVGAAEEVLPAYYETAGSGAGQAGPSEDFLHPDVIVVDPPRKGCERSCLDTMLQMRPDRIVYVSCDSATLARDLRILADGGYRLRQIQPVDMFPHTVHVETVCLMSRVEGK